MVKYLEGFTPYKKEDAEIYEKFRWWAGLTFGDLLDRAADIHPDKEAFVDRKTRLTFQTGMNSSLPISRYRRSGPSPCC
jgi:non-ribosomal peptide synthetase component E (peptide arylation enzyme)